MRPCGVNTFKTLSLRDRWADVDETGVFILWFCGSGDKTCRKRDVVGAVVQLVEYRTHNREVSGSTHTRSTASNLEQVVNLLCAQAN